MSMDYIRRAYGVPAKRGMRLRFKDSIGGDREGTIVGSRAQYLRVRLDGENWTRMVHPTWPIEYLKTPNARGKPPKVGLGDGLGPLPEPAGWNDHGEYFDYTADQMRAYAAQEVAAERERCAKICDGVANRVWRDTRSEHWSDEVELLARTIRGA